MVAVLGDACVDEDGVDAPECGVAGGEAGALGRPGCDVAFVEEDMVGWVREGCWWVQKDEVVVGVQGREGCGGCDTDA